MITRYITAVKTTFSPFSRAGKTARIFLAQLPPNARSTMAIDVHLQPRVAAAAAATAAGGADVPALLDLTFKDGKKISLDLASTKMREIETEVDRHSRTLKRKEELAG